MAGMRPGGVRQVLVPYGALSYPEDDLPHLILQQLDDLLRAACLPETRFRNHQQSTSFQGETRQTANGPYPRLRRIAVSGNPESENSL